MKRSEMIDIIEDAILDFNGALLELAIFNNDACYDLAKHILTKIEKAGMLPPKSLDTICVKKGLVRGYTQMFEWDVEELEKEIQKLKEQRNKYNSLAGAHSWRVEELEKENQELKAKLEKWNDDC